MILLSLYPLTQGLISICCDLFVSVCKNNVKKLIERVNKELQIMEKDNTYLELYKTYLSIE